MECLMKYTWPGNVRELRNVMERCVNLSVQDVITLDCLPAELQREQNFSPASEEFKTPTKPDHSEQDFAGRHYGSYEEYECRRIVELMKKYKELENSFFDIQMENLQLKNELDKLRKQEI